MGYLLLIAFIVTIVLLDLYLSSRALGAREGEEG